MKFTKEEVLEMIQDRINCYELAIKHLCKDDKELKDQYEVRILELTSFSFDVSVM